ncbi:MAG TPA: class I SAM-dependent methyltransferase [Gammaproteobacteria bacterium]|nr:class I SAM-dependent methyltransferase [Gammaproteobacteria bacterium]
MSTTAADLDLLSRIGTQYGTDKVSHGFCTFYDRHLRTQRKRIAKVLEIGIFGGSSLYMWRDYFPNAVIHGMDLGPVNLDPVDRITTYVGDQEDRATLQAIIDNAGTDFDLIIDDGGHTMGQQQTSLGYLFPHVRPGGYYVVEDLHTSFMQRIDLYEDGKAVDYYETGVGKCQSTTYEIIQAISEGSPVGSEYMSEAERRYLADRVQWSEIFDRNGDRQHMTCILKKRPLSLIQRISLGMLKRWLG